MAKFRRYDGFSGSVPQKFIDSKLTRCPMCGNVLVNFDNDGNYWCDSCDRRVYKWDAIVEDKHKFKDEDDENAKRCPKCNEELTDLGLDDEYFCSTCGKFISKIFVKGEALYDGGKEKICPNCGELLMFLDSINEYWCDSCDHVVSIRAAKNVDGHVRLCPNCFEILGHPDNDGECWCEHCMEYISKRGAIEEERVKIEDKNEEDEDNEDNEDYDVFRDDDFCTLKSALESDELAYYNLFGDWPPDDDHW